MNRANSYKIMCCGSNEYLLAFPPVYVRLFFRGISPLWLAALEGGEWSAARHGRPLPPEKTRYPFYRRLGGPQGQSGRAKNLVLTGIRSRTVQPVVSPYIA